MPTENTAIPTQKPVPDLERYRTPLLLSILAGAVLYVGSLLLSDMDATLDALGSLSATGWAAILALSLVNYLLRYWRWQQYIHQLSGQRLPHRFHLTCYLAGFALTTTPGKAGEAARSIYLNQYGIRWSHSLSTFFVERLLDLFAILLLSLVALQVFPNYSWVGYVTATLITLVMLGLHTSLLHRLLQFLSHSTSERISTASRHLSALLTSAGALLRPRSLSRGMVLGLISWGCEGVALYLILEQLGAPISLSLAIGIYAAGILAGALSFIPGGLGSTEAVMAFMLIASGVDSPVAIAATLLCRVATLWFAVLLGLAAMARLTGQAPPQTPLGETTEQ